MNSISNVIGDLLATQFPLFESVLNPAFMADIRTLRSESDAVARRAFAFGYLFQMNHPERNFSAIPTITGTWYVVDDWFGTQTIPLLAAGCDKQLVVQAIRLGIWTASLSNN